MHTDKFKKYINSLCDKNGIPISNIHKTGFLGIICLGFHYLKN